MERAFDESNGLARQIIGDGERVLDRQGYRVSLKHSSLARYGYTAIEFHDMDYSGETVVILEHAGVPYQLHLDVNYNLDFKGKTPPSADFQAFLLYTALSYLKPIVCEPSDSTVVRDAGTERRSNAEGTLLSRIGHFRKLPAGHTYSKEAVGNCATYTRRNLHDINALNRMRGLPLRTFVKPTPEVPPTEEEFNNLTPRKVSVPTPAALEKSS